MELVKIPTSTKKFNFNFVPEHILSGQYLRDFIFAGNALFTVVNEDTKNHVTIKIKKHKDEEIWFVSVLDAGLYNTIGTLSIFLKTMVYKHSENSMISSNHRKVKVFRWFYTNFLDKQDKYPMIKVYHHGKCGRCGKKLTTPNSIKEGIGPVCGGKRK